jgi:translation initiation factor 3 subunit I
LKGHSRPITKVKFNRQGDLFATCAKDNKPQLWFTDNGERLGTFNGHQGSVWECDIDFNSTRLLTASADRTARLWDLKTGHQLWKFDHESAVRDVGFSHGDKMILTVQDNSFKRQPTVFIYNIAANLEEQDGYVRAFNSGPETGIIVKAVWGSLNLTVIGGCEDGTIRVWDVQDGKEICCSDRDTGHKKKITDLQLSADGNMIVTTSTDHTARIWDIRQKQIVHKKTFRSDRPLNSASFSSKYDQIVVGGGQDAMDVTTTAADAGHFEADFYHIVHQEKLGSVTGHFGPINTLSFSPNGRSYVSGGEDGYLRLHHFDQSYFRQSERYTRRDV